MNPIPASTRTYLVVGFALIGILITVLGVWGTQTKIDGAIIAPGRLAVEGSRKAVQHSKGGEVKEVLVADGDNVAAGQILVRLDGTFPRSELAIIQDQLWDLRARAARRVAEREGHKKISWPAIFPVDVQNQHDLKEIIQGQSRLFETRLNLRRRENQQIRQQIAQTESQITGINAQVLALQNQSALIEEELNAAQSLFRKGLAHATRLSALRREQSKIQGEIGQLGATIARLDAQISSLEVELLRRDNIHKSEAIAVLRDLNAQIRELEQRELSIKETLLRLDIRSPVIGVVHDSQAVSSNSIISPAQTILYVIPNDRPMEVIARIEARHIEQVQVGQAAIFRFTVFDQRRIPEVEGQVTWLSADSYTDEGTGAVFYQAKLSAYPGEFAKLGKLKPIAGMPVEVFIRTGSQTPLEYLTRPFADYFVRAFRET